MAIFQEYRPEIPSTLPAQVSLAREVDLSYKVLHRNMLIRNETDGNIMVPFSSYINQYRIFLTDIIVTSELTQDEYRKYVYQPKTFSQDLYETTELWDTILILNQCTSVIEFDLKTVKYYDPDKLKSYLNEILILEEVDR